MSQATRKDNAEPQPTHRLSRMTVQEVSLVDKAANMRKFILMKMADPSKLEGVPLIKEDAGAAAGAIAADATAAAPDAATTSAGAGGTMQAQVKEELTGALADQAQKIVAIANQLDGVEVSDQPADPPVPADVLKQISDAGAALTALAAKYGAAAKPDDAGATDAAAVAAAQGGTTPAPAGAPASDVAKAGRRMAKERLDRLGKAIDALIGLMKELRYEDQRRAAKTLAARAKTEKAAELPAIALDEVSALIAATEGLVEEHATTKQALTKAESAVVVATAELKKHRAKIAELEKRVGPSNVIAPDATNGGPQRHHWPNDLTETLPRPALAR